MFWQNLWEGAKSTFQSVWTWLSNFFTVTIPDIFNTVISFIETNWQGLLLLLVNPFAGAFKLIYDNCEGFRTKVNEVVSAVLNTLRELPAQVLSVGRNLVEGLWNGINDKLLWLKDKIKSFTESVLDSIKHFFGVNSPSKKTAWIGDMLDQGLASGLLDNMRSRAGHASVSDGVLSAAGGTYQTQMVCDADGVRICGWKCRDFGCAGAHGPARARHHVHADLYGRKRCGRRRCATYGCGAR